MKLYADSVDFYDTLTFVGKFPDLLSAVRAIAPNTDGWTLERLHGDFYELHPPEDLVLTERQIRDGMGATYWVICP